MLIENCDFTFNYHFNFLQLKDKGVDCSQTARKVISFTKFNRNQKKTA